MFKKIVSVILEKKISQKTLDIIFEFAKNNSADNFFISLIDSKIIERICSETGRKRKKVEEEQILKRYRELYEIEEFFKTKNMNINFETRIFKGYEEMSTILNSLEPDIIVFCEPDESELKEIIKIKTVIPFLIIRNDKY